MKKMVPYSMVSHEALLSLLITIFWSCKQKGNREKFASSVPVQKCISYSKTTTENIVSKVET